MTTETAGQASTPAMSGLTPEQGISRLLELIRSSRSIGDFTPERLGQALGVTVQSSGDSYGYGQPVSADWSQNFVMQKGLGRFDFSFDPLQAGNDADMQGVCYEVDRLSSELEGMGFSKQEQRGEHGRLMNYRFERGGDGQGVMRLEVTPQAGRSGAAGSDMGRACVRAIHIY